MIFLQFKIKPQLHYGEDDCPIQVSSNFPKDDELHFEIEMIDFFKAKASKFALCLLGSKMLIILHMGMVTRSSFKILL